MDREVLQPLTAQGLDKGEDPVGLSPIGTSQCLAPMPPAHGGDAGMARPG
jgi:hypothetical protein